MCWLLLYHIELWRHKDTQVLVFSCLFGRILLLVDNGVARGWGVGLCESFLAANHVCIVWFSSHFHLVTQLFYTSLCIWLCCCHGAVLLPVMILFFFALWALLLYVLFLCFHPWQGDWAVCVQVTVATIFPGWTASIWQVTSSESIRPIMMCCLPIQRKTLFLFHLTVTQMIPFVHA